MNSTKQYSILGVAVVLVVVCGYFLYRGNAPKATEVFDTTSKNTIENTSPEPTQVEENAPLLKTGEVVPPVEKPLPAKNNTSTKKKYMNNSDVTKLDIQVTQEGTGPVSKVGDMLSMNYTGMLLDGSKFDSNVDPAFGHVQPFTFPLGGGQVIQGWDMGLVGMKVGEKRTLTIPSNLAYGSRAMGTKIPANSALVFEVELLKIN